MNIEPGERGKLNLDWLGHGTLCQGGDGGRGGGGNDIAKSWNNLKGNRSREKKKKMEE